MWPVGIEDSRRLLRHITKQDLNTGLRGALVDLEREISPHVIFRPRIISRMIHLQLNGH